MVNHVSSPLTACNQNNLDRRRLNEATYGLNEHLSQLVNSSLIELSVLSTGTRAITHTNEDSYGANMYRYFTGTYKGLIKIYIYVKLKTSKGRYTPSVSYRYYCDGIRFR